MDFEVKWSFNHTLPTVEECIFEGGIDTMDKVLEAVRAKGIAMQKNKEETKISEVIEAFVKNHNLDAKSFAAGLVYHQIMC